MSVPSWRHEQLLRVVQMRAGESRGLAAQIKICRNMHMRIEMRQARDDGLQDLDPGHCRHSQSVTVPKHAAEERFDFGHVVVSTESDKAILFHGSQVIVPLDVIGGATELLCNLLQLLELLAKRMWVDHGYRRRIVCSSIEEVQARAANLLAN